MTGVQSRLLLGIAWCLLGLASISLSRAAGNAAPPPAGNASTSVYLEELTSPELAAQIRAGKTTIIVPVGGTEQNGPHMALGKHNVRVKALAGRIAQTLGNALVAPVIAYVPEGSLQPPTAHMRYAGTITLPASVFEATLEAAGRSFRVHGFRDIVFIGDHGGYQSSLKAAAAKLNREWARTPVRAHAIEEYYHASDAGYAQLLRARGYRPDEIGTHAGVGDTSLALAIDPSLVRTDRLQSSADPALGVAGDPARANAQIGQMGVDLIVARTVNAIRDAVRR